MEPNDDRQLRELLTAWKTEPHSPDLEDRVMRARRRWWQAMFTGYIRIPIPVACCLIPLLIVGAWRTFRPPTAPCSSAAVLHCSLDKSC